MTILHFLCAYVAAAITPKAIVVFQSESNEGFEY